MKPSDLASLPRSARGTATSPISASALGATLKSEATALLVAFAALALGVAFDDGHYSGRAIFLVSVGAAALVFATRQRLPDNRDAHALAPQLALVLVLLLVVGACHVPGAYLQSATYQPIYVGVQLTLAVAILVNLRRPDPRGRGQQTIFAAAVVLGFGLRLGMVSASPAPIIDVFNQFQESAQHWLQGLNPYLTPVSDPYEGRINFGYQVTGYAYPPANLYLHTLAYLAGGDIRYGYIACEALAMVCLHALVPARERAAARWLVLLFLFQPRGLFVIEQAWTEPFLVGAGGAFLWLAARRPESRWAAVVFGIFLSLKQYLVFFAALFLAPRAHWRWLGVVTAVVAATWLPFLLWDFDSAINNGLLFQFRTGFRSGGLTLSSVFYRWFGWESTKWVAIGLGAITLAFAYRKLNHRGLGGQLHGSVLATLAAFLAGSQAFCNYYYFLGAMILFLLAVRLRETEALRAAVAERVVDAR